MVHRPAQGLQQVTNVDLPSLLQPKPCDPVDVRLDGTLFGLVHHGQRPGTHGQASSPLPPRRRVLSEEAEGLGDLGQGAQPAVPGDRVAQCQDRILARPQCRLGCGPDRGTGRTVHLEAMLLQPIAGRRRRQELGDGCGYDPPGPRTEDAAPSGHRRSGMAAGPIRCRPRRALPAHFTAPAVSPLMR